MKDLIYPIYRLAKAAGTVDFRTGTVYLIPSLADQLTLYEELAHIKQDKIFQSLGLKSEFAFRFGIPEGESTRLETIVSEIGIQPHLQTTALRTGIRDAEHYHWRYFDEAYRLPPETYNIVCRIFNFTYRRVDTL